MPLIKVTDDIAVNPDYIEAVHLIGDTDWYTGVHVVIECTNNVLELDPRHSMDDVLAKLQGDSHG